MRQHGLRPAAAVRHLTFDLCQVVPPLTVMPRDGLAGQRHRSRRAHKVQEHTVLRIFEVIRLDLSRHVHRDKALQPQHHLRQGAVNVVDDPELQPLFQQHGHAEHPFFREIRVLGHLLHGHIAVHNDRLHGAGQHRRLHEVQLAFHHLLQPEIAAGGGELERRRRHLQFVETDRADVLVQVELVQLGEEVVNAILPGRMAAQQPVPQPLAVYGPISQRRRLAVQQRPGNLPVLDVIQLAGHIGGHRPGEAHRICRLPRPAAEPKYGGRVIVGVPAQPADAQLHYLHQRVEVLPQLHPVGDGVLLAG